MGVLGAASGCALVGFAAHVVAGGDEANTVTVPAEYEGLTNQTTAVLVAADEYTLYEYPAATSAICQQISARLAVSIPGIQVADPKQIQRFQDANPFWATLPYNQLLKRLGVQRLVYIDLIRYTTHESGNAYVWRGTVTANLGVAAADADDPDRFVYATTTQANYPPNQTGRLNSDNQTIQLGMLHTFAQHVTNLFQDHKAVQK